MSEESAVTDVLGKVTSGQADAGLVYVTDAKGAGDKVTAVPFPESTGAVNTYPIAVLKESTNPAAAQKFVDLVTGAAGAGSLGGSGLRRSVTVRGAPAGRSRSGCPPGSTFRRRSVRSS